MSERLLIPGAGRLVSTSVRPSARRQTRYARWLPDLPDLPGRLAACPLLFECTPFTHRVHRAPVPFMLEDRELSVARQPLERLALEDGLRADVVEGLSLEDEETTVDPSLIELRLLAELRGEVAADVQLTETARRPNSGDRRELPLLPVELEKLPVIHVRDAVN